MDTSNRPQQNKAKKRPTHRASYSKGLNKEFEQRIRRLDNVVDLTNEAPDSGFLGENYFLTKFYGVFIKEGDSDA